MKNYLLLGCIFVMMLFVSCSDSSDSSGSDDEVIAGKGNTQVQTSNTGWWKYDDSNTVVWLYYSGNVNEPYRVGNSEKEYKENSLTQAKALYLFNNEQVFKNLKFCEDWRSIPTWAFKEPGSIDVQDSNRSNVEFWDSLTVTKKQAPSRNNDLSGPQARLLHAFCACNYIRLPLTRQHKTNVPVSRFTPSRLFFLH